MQSFNWQFQLVEEGMESTSILASLANPFAVLFIPLGFGAWQLAAAAITGFIAKENVVGTLAVVYGDVYKRQQMQSQGLHPDERKSEQENRLSGSSGALYEHRLPQDGEMRAGRGG